MSRTIGRGVDTPKETIESVKQELNVAQKAGVELIKKNKELEDKLKEAELQLREKETIAENLAKKNKELEDKIKETEAKSAGRSTSKAE